MDAYLKSGRMKDVSNFYLNINFELLNGCKLNCTGCHVEKTAQNPFSIEDADKLLKLLDELKVGLYRPFIAFVGPTDFLSADNTIALFSNELVKKVLRKFQRLSIQTTFFEMRKAKEVAQVLKENFSDMELEINIVFDPVKVKDKYILETIEKNKKQFLSYLGREDVLTFGFMNVVNYDKNEDYDSFHDRLSHLFETSIDYNFSYGRNPEMGREDFKQLVLRMKEMFEKSSSADKNTPGRITDSLIERQYSYRNGKLYYSPLLYERFVSFHPKFEVPLKEFSGSELESFEMMVQLDQYNNASIKDECENCPLLSSCIDRGILFLMDAYQEKSCVVAKNAMFAVNTMGTLPIAGR